MQANAFELEADLSGFTAYQRGGIVTQHKSPKQLAFKPLQVGLPACCDTCLVATLSRRTTT